ncbi:MAG: hypothetical protein SOX31_03865, partial [Eubacteriales bacterium]|nr:hypothetical protein [Eubacteriales bacterium]
GKKLMRCGSSPLTISKIYNKILLYTGRAASAERGSARFLPRLSIWDRVSSERLKTPAAARQTADSHAPALFHSQHFQNLDLLARFYYAGKRIEI